MPPRCLRGDTKELNSSLSASPGGAYGQIQVPGLAASGWGGAARGVHSGLLVGRAHEGRGKRVRAPAFCSLFLNFLT